MGKEPFELKRHENGSELLLLTAWHGHQGVSAGFTTRWGGVSKHPYNNLNVGLHVADDSVAVVRNRTIIAEAIGIPLTQWTFGEQVHGDRVAILTAADAGKGTILRDTAIEAADAFITKEKGLCLATMYADCVPIYFYDPVNEGIGLAHAGWKGTVMRIVEKTVQAMTASFGTRADQLLTVIGPSIGACCYEVDEHVASRIWQLDLDDGVLFSTSGGKYMLNLQEVNRQLLQKAGILPSHIELSQMCTSCRTDLLFSHRKEQGATGRMLAWLGLTHSSDH